MTEGVLFSGPQLSYQYVSGSEDKMSFFLKKNVQVEPAVTTETETPARVVELSGEGVAIASRLSGQRVVIPRGFRISADRFTVSDGVGLVEGEFEGHLVGVAKTEVCAGGRVVGKFTGNALDLRGEFEGMCAVGTLRIHQGGIYSGSVTGLELLLSEGAHFNGEFRRVQETQRTPSAL